MNTLTVELGARSYPIYFRENAQPELVERTLATASSGRVLVLSDEKVGSLYANQFVEELPEL